MNLPCTRNLLEHCQRWDDSQLAAKGPVNAPPPPVSLPGWPYPSLRNRGEAAPVQMMLLRPFITLDLVSKAKSLSTRASKASYVKRKRSWLKVRLYLIFFSQWSHLWSSPLRTAAKYSDYLEPPLFPSWSIFMYTQSTSAQKCKYMQCYFTVLKPLFIYSKLAGTFSRAFIILDILRIFWKLE